MAERLTIIDFVEKYVSKFSSNPFLWEKNLDTNVWESTTYEQTLQKAKRIAAGLMALGVQKGEKISYLSEGRDMWVIGELGVLYAGAVNVPLSIKLGESNDLVFRVKHSDSKYVITSKFQLPKIRAILPECPMVEKVIIFDEVADMRENEIYIGEIIRMGDEFLAENENLFPPFTTLATRLMLTTVSLNSTSFLLMSAIFFLLLEFEPAFSGTFG